MKAKNSIREKGTGSIVKKRNRFYLKLRIGDVCKTFLLRGKDDTPVTNRKEAESAAALLRPVLRAQQKEEIALYVADARKLKKQSRITPSEIWTTYLKQSSRPDSGKATLSCYHSAVKLFLEWLNKEYPDMEKAELITKAIAAEYFNDLWESGVSVRTYNSYRQALLLVFKHILPEIALDENPFSGIPHKTGKAESRKTFTEEQVTAIFSGFQTGFFYTSEIEVLGKERKRIRKKVTAEYIPLHKDEMFVLLNLCCWTGCRGQDGCLMKWENVDFQRNLITYVPQKTAKKTAWRPVVLPIHAMLSKALHTALTWRERNKPGEDYILPNVADRHLQNYGGIQKDVMKIIQCATGTATTGRKEGSHRKLNPNIYSLHSFRHTFVSFCANAGVSLDVVASIVGHSSPEMTRHYAHISEHAKQAVIKALPSLKTMDTEMVDQRNMLLQQIEKMPAEQIAVLLRNLNVQQSATASP